MLGEGGARARKVRDMGMSCISWTMTEHTEHIQCGVMSGAG